MRIAIAQINPKVGDIQGNAALVKKFAAAASSAGAELAVFPELALTGYPPLDLLERRGFVASNLAALKKIAAFRCRSAIVLGYVDFNRARSGKKLLNCAALVAGGKIAASRAKSLLPAYDIFDEARYFEPGQENLPVVLNGKKLGLTVCEDIWAQTGLLPRRLLYKNDPVKLLCASKADIIINISASPYYHGKTARRFSILSSLSKSTGKPIVYANQSGGNDGLIFDGSSFILDSKGRLRAKAAPFREDLIFADVAPDVGSAKALKFLQSAKGEEFALALTLGIRDYFHKSGHTKAVLGLSGGIDSAVVAALAVRALGPENVTALLMSSPYTSPQSVCDALKLVKNLGMKHEILPIKSIYSSFLNTLGGVSTRAKTGRAGEVELYMQNLQSRARGVLLMARANKTGALALATGNKSEIAMGYCTLYGDTAGALAPLADLLKDDVYELADWLNRHGDLIPRAIIRRPPTAELKPGQLDCDDLPGYRILDRVLRLYIERDETPAKIAAATGLARQEVVALIKRIEASEYKRSQLPTGLKISEKSFCAGRRMPIVKSFDFLK